MEIQKQDVSPSGTSEVAEALQRAARPPPEVAEALQRAARQPPEVAEALQRAHEHSCEWFDVGLARVKRTLGA